MVLMFDPRDFDWVIRQRRPGGAPEDDVTVTINVGLSALSPDGTGTFSGDAVWDGRQGEMAGAINGDAMEFVVAWPDGNAGRYLGHWYPDGYLRGHTYSVNNPAENAEWWTATNNAREVEV
jgi:hypothetical protein